MKIVLTTHNHLGDTVALTAALRNAKEALPDAQFDYDGNYRGVFDNNPDITPFDHDDPDALRIDVSYKPFSQQKGDGGNLCNGYTKCLALALKNLTGVIISFSQHTPVINLTDDEKLMYTELGRYCVVNANCQKCSEVKHYPHWQTVIDMASNMKFVQVGGNEQRDISTELKRVIDMRGETSVRQLFALVANSAYVVSPSSAVIHIAAAFPDVNAICLTGAREPVALTQYHNVGHITSHCGGHFSAFGCMLFHNHGARKACRHTTNFNGFDYAQCMWDISPKEIAECLI